MEGLIILLVFVVFVLPLILSIVALVKVTSLRRDYEASRRAEQIPPAWKEPPLPEETPAKEIPDAFKVPEPVVSPPPIRPAAAKPPPAAPKPPKPKAGIEFMLGGKAASFAGIAILVIGIVLLVGYSIQQGWIGPGTRIILGLLCGGAMVGIGHFVERKDDRYQLFARVLTGGGGALFYFCVFAAYSIYQLIGVWMAGVGLVASAFAVFGLAMAYRSQAVGVLGVLGAFITPLLIGGDFDKGVFPLVYIAVINAPVILLGIKRNWQVLYNLSFVLTVIIFCIWLDWFGRSEWWIGLAFAVGYFLEYAALGLLKLRCEQRIAGRRIDIVRLLLASLLLLGAVYWILDDAGMDGWLGTAFLAMALLHIGLAAFAFKVLARFNEEILAFLAGGLVFATLALPAQLDGEWVSLGWAIEGVVLAWFAGRVRSRLLQCAAFLLGFFGIMKSLVFDVSLHDAPGNLFLNARFMVGLLSAALLGVQGWLAGRFDDETTPKWQEGLWWVAVLSALAVFFADTFWTIGPDEALAWVMTSLALLVAGAALVYFMPAQSSLQLLGGILLILVPLKLFLLDSWIGFDVGGYRMRAFANPAVYIQLFALAVVAFLLPRRMAGNSATYMLPSPDFSTLLNILSLAGALGVLTIELFRISNDWAGTAVTILWAVSAITLTIFGLARRRRAHRYFGLILIGLTTLKVLVVDSSELKGLERISAFIVTGVLLLLLSFAYQKASAYFHSLEDNNEEI
ncbi:hypothetical protein PDESU_05618 [Pontiella desulfatans]|uniref:DUF2339 domain-containing protein n=1 Tax=Pontiella desulfatans TaxID=2750659 RepID=A0A6C2UCC1_PONDE|nr:DUF2339 domain-containing protein [Pontiella desulfatans]VGO17024.1 hypothetical protein PDESU_05618 [Pontiella desulfatans]